MPHPLSALPGTAAGHWCPCSSLPQSRTVHGLGNSHANRHSLASKLQSALFNLRKVSAGQHPVAAVSAKSGSLIKPLPTGVLSART